MRLSYCFKIVKPTLFVLLSFGAFSQEQYFVYLKNKSGNNYSINEPTKFLSQRAIKRRSDQQIPISSRDLPLSNTYIQKIKETGATIFHVSKWMNAVLLKANSAQMTAIRKLDFVKSVEGNRPITGGADLQLFSKNKIDQNFNALENYNYGNSLNQIQQLGADAMHKKGFTGKDVLIGVFDSGFLNANKLDVFKTLFDQKRVLATYDFVSHQANVYDDHNHGTQVLSCMVGNSPNNLIGTAPDAQVALFRTEDDASETLLEEVNWLLAAEFADSLGVDIINSSLGYTTFDDAAQNHRNADMTGDKTIAAKAADWAVGVGMLVVVSAGNDGATTWRHISTPADADSVLAVGAVDASEKIASFSSIGPNAKGNVKPELVAKGVGTTLWSETNFLKNGNGTSFSSPLLAGFAGALKQAYLMLSAMKLREILIQSGSQYNSPDAFKGYGLPNFERAAALAEKYLQTFLLGVSSEKHEAKVFPNPIGIGSMFTVLINGSPLPESTLLDVFSSYGRLIFGSQTLLDFREQSSTLISGVYFVRFYFKEQPYTLKIIKE